jgi:hypothetical protein
VGCRLDDCDDKFLGVCTVANSVKGAETVISSFTEMLCYFRCPTRVSPQARRSPTLARGAACEGAAPPPATTPPRLLTRTTGNSSNSSSNSSSSRRPQDSNSAPTSRAAFVGAVVVAAHGEYGILPIVQTELDVVE